MTSFIRKLCDCGMSFHALRVLGGSLLLGGTLVACSSVTPLYYSLAPIGGEQVHDQTISPHVVEVRLPSVVGSLDRDTLVRGVYDYHLDVSSHSSWGAPLSEMIGNTLVNDLTQRLPQQVVFAQNSSVAVKPDVYMELSIRHFEEDETGHVVIEGVLSTHQVASSELDKGHTLIVQWRSKERVTEGDRELVHLLSKGMGTIADQAVELLKQDSKK